jgi:hypothetical protein
MENFSENNWDNRDNDKNTDSPEKKINEYESQDRNYKKYNTRKING